MGFNLDNLNITKISKEYLLSLKSKSVPERILIIIWSLMPFIMMLSKSIADFFIVAIAISFLIFSLIKFSWSWLEISWLRLAILFYLIANLSACLSLLVETSLSNGLAWIRFPLFAAAMSYWLIKEKHIFYFTLFINFLSIIFIFFLMGLETIFTDHNTFEWPFRNPLNGPFIHRIGILFFSIAFLILFLDVKYKILASSFIVISIIFSLLSGHRVGTFSFIIIILILTFWPKFNLKRTSLVMVLFLITLTLFFSFNIEKLDRYFFGVYNLSNTSFLQYLGQWKTGIIVFLDNPIFGIGPTNVQNYLSENIIINYDPYKNNEHPHNHYIQAFAETGLLGGFLYSAIFLKIIFDCYIGTKFKNGLLESLISKGVFISSICIFWPFANNYDLFGQQQNSYLWYVISILLVSNSLNKRDKILSK